MLALFFRYVMLVNLEELEKMNVDDWSWWSLVVPELRSVSIGKPRKEKHAYPSLYRAGVEYHNGQLNPMRDEAILYRLR